MRERITAIIAIILLLILIAASYWYAMQSTYSNLRYLPSEESPDFIAGGATLISFDKNGVADSKLKAEELRHYSDDRMTMVKPEAVTVSPDKPVTHAQALAGRSDDGGATFVFKGDVIITRVATGNTPTTRLETQSMTVYTDTNRFVTDDVVLITSGQDTAQGQGMVFDNMERTVELKGQVTTVLQPRNNNQRLLPSSTH